LRRAKLFARAAVRLKEMIEMATLLIADDNRDIRELYKMEFECEGYAVVTAADGIEALEMTKLHCPGLSDTGV